ncbi:MAG: sporulation protein YabP [Bacillaceae bacterium]
MNTNNYAYGSQNNQTAVVQHDITLNGRKILEINGVKQVESFDSEEFLLQTVMGMLHIRGSNLQMKNLDVEKGIVSIKGKINGFEYLDENTTGKSKGIFSKLFK